MKWKSWIAAVAMIATAATAAETSPDYTPPTGFNGLTWGAPLSALGAVKLARANTVTDSKGKATQLRCTEKPEGCANVVEDSDQDVEGVGSFAVAEYYREPDSNPWATALVALHSATYLFCDEWLGSSVRNDVKQRMRFCGARIFYRSDSIAQRPTGAQTNHDRLLRHLIREFGPPDGHRLPAGHVSVGPVTESNADAATNTPQDIAPESEVGGVLRYRWCGMHDKADALVPPCRATITLLFNRDSGWGMVLFATDAVYRFAQARHATQDENNELYMALISGNPRKPTHRNTNDCMRTTGSLICGGKLAALSDRDRRRFEP